METVLMEPLQRMPPSAALKILGLWDDSRRKAFQEFVSLFALDSSDMSLARRILGFADAYAEVGQEPCHSIPTASRIAAAQKIVEAIRLPINVMTILDDDEDAFWVLRMSQAPAEYPGPAVSSFPATQMSSEGSISSLPVSGTDCTDTGVRLFNNVGANGELVDVPVNSHLDTLFTGPSLDFLPTPMDGAVPAPSMSNSANAPISGLFCVQPMGPPLNVAMHDQSAPSLIDAAVTVSANERLPEAQRGLFDPSINIPINDQFSISQMDLSNPSTDLF